MVRDMEDNKERCLPVWRNGYLFLRGMVGSEDTYRCVAGVMDEEMDSAIGSNSGYLCAICGVGDRFGIWDL